MTKDEWIQKMAQLIKERDRADSMIGSWTRKRAVVDQAIDDLAAGHTVYDPADVQESVTQPTETPEQATEPAPETV